MPEVKNVYSGKVARGSAVQGTQQSLEQVIARTRQIIDNQYNAHSRHIRHARDAMTVSTRAWENQGVAPINLYCNPSDMRWNMPRRGTVVKTAAGAVRNVWRNRYRGTYYDEGTVGVTFQTGNIMPSAAWQNEAELRSMDGLGAAWQFPRVPPGLLDFYRFIALLDQAMLMGPTENRHIMHVHTRAFPNLKLEGYFLEDSFTFSEVATDGNRLQWEATFQIYQMKPNIWNSTGLESAYADFITQNQAEAVGWQNAAQYLYADGVSDMPGVGPVGPPLQGPASAKKVTTVAASSQRAKTLADQAFNRLPADQRTLEGFFGI